MSDSAHIEKPKRRWWPVIVALCCGLLVGAGALLAALHFLQNKTQPMVPESIAQSISFSVLAPESKDGYTASDFSFDGANGVLSFTLRGPEATFAITQQATPDSFTEIPQYYDKLTESLLEYKRFDTDIGQVSLTKPKEFNGQQAAVMNTKGTLLFARPDTELSDETWRLFFKKVQVHN